MNVYQSYKDGQGGKTGPWLIKYPYGRNPLTGKIKCKIEKVGEFKELAERACRDPDKVFGMMLINTKLRPLRKSQLPSSSIKM